MQPITTSLTKLLNTKTPIVVPPLAFAATPDLLKAAIDNGGFAFAAVVFETSAKIKQSLGALRTKFQVPEGVPMPIGVGLIGCLLDKTEASDDPRLPTVLDHLPAAIWLAFSADLGKNVAQIRAHTAQRAHKPLIFVMINSVDEGLRAANEWKVDVIVAQGIEAGGHGDEKAPATNCLVQGLLHALPNGPPIIAAGGIATGAQIASFLTLGADGVVLGSRMLFTHECPFPEGTKNVLLKADLHSTIRSYAFDEAARMPFWPKGIDGRAIANHILTDKKAGLSLEERQKNFDDGKTRGEVDRLVIWAGEGVGLVHEIKGTTDVIRGLHEETVARLQAGASLLG